METKIQASDDVSTLAVLTNMAPFLLVVMLKHSVRALLIRQIVSSILSVELPTKMLLLSEVFLVLTMCWNNWDRVSATFKKDLRSARGNTESRGHKQD